MKIRHRGGDEAALCMVVESTRTFKVSDAEVLLRMISRESASRMSNEVAVERGAGISVVVVIVVRPVSSAR